MKLYITVDYYHNYEILIRMIYYLITVVLGVLFIGTVYIVEFLVVPHLKEDNKFFKFWRRHIIGEDPFEE
jgi:phage shock protein PspC (stress-responsive transcriptional regulator)